ncbi:DMT family transporter [Halosimplex litoreum]|uniref:DMT family transporter n=1 Tax=Halosimplex litoreum TaxID=1198301 RepID=A0A7T3FZK3_9EURY|nr:DMT family transporter [Halosimplex litoreum]QPV63487.1 DMT family transporter [Halosimplex litoreum]
MAGETLSRRLEARVPPVAALVVAILAVSTSAILVRWSGAPPTVAAFYRVLFTVWLLAPLAASRHGEALRSLGRRDALAAGATGVALAIHFAAWFQSIEWTSVAASVTLVQAQPLFVAVGAALYLDERLTLPKVVGILIALGGATVMSVGEFLAGTAVGPHPLAGNALALAGAVTMAVYVLAGRSLRARVALVPYVTVVYAVCAAVLGAVVVAQGDPLVGYAGREWLLFLAMAVGPGIFGHTVINWALEHVQSSVVSVSLLGEPVGSTVLALLLLAEVPGRWTVAGGAVVLGGIYLTARTRSES